MWSLSVKQQEYTGHPPQKNWTPGILPSKVTQVTQVTRFDQVPINSNY